MTPTFVDVQRKARLAVVLRARPSVPKDGDGDGKRAAYKGGPDIIPVVPDFQHARMMLLQAYQSRGLSKSAKDKIAEADRFIGHGSPESAIARLNEALPELTTEVSRKRVQAALATLGGARAATVPARRPTRVPTGAERAAISKDYIRRYESGESVADIANSSQWSDTFVRRILNEGGASAAKHRESVARRKAAAKATPPAKVAPRPAQRPESAPRTAPDSDVHNPQRVDAATWKTWTSADHTARASWLIHQLDNGGHIPGRDDDDVMRESRFHRAQSGAKAKLEKTTAAKTTESAPTAESLRESVRQERERRAAGLPSQVPPPAEADTWSADILEQVRAASPDEARQILSDLSRDELERLGAEQGLRLGKGSKATLVDKAVAKTRPGVAPAMTREQQKERKALLNRNAEIGGALTDVASGDVATMRERLAVRTLLPDDVRARLNYALGTGDRAEIDRVRAELASKYGLIPVGRGYDMVVDGERLRVSTEAGRDRAPRKVPNATTAPAPRITEREYDYLSGSVPWSVVEERYRASLRRKGLTDDAGTPTDLGRRAADAFVPPFDGASAAADVLARPDRFAELDESELLRRLGSYGVTQLRAIARAMGIYIPATNGGQRWDATSLRRFLAHVIANRPRSAVRSRMDLQDVTRRAKVAAILRAAGADVTPGSDELHHYWTRGPGLARWAASPHPWRTLHAALAEVLAEHGRTVSPEQLNSWVSAWVKEVTGLSTGDDRYRLRYGGKIRGHRIGKG